MRYPLVKYQSPVVPEGEEIIEGKAKRLPPRAISIMVQVIIYVSLALFAYVVIRGGSPELALFLPFVLALLRLLLGRK